MSQFPAQPSPYDQYGSQPPPTARKPGLPLWAKLLIGGIIAAGVLAVLICAGLLYFGVKTPAIMAVPGSNMRAVDMEVVNRLGLLDPGEQIKFFYSDGMLSVEEGMYFFTNEKVVIYADGAPQKAQIITYSQIEDITMDQSDSWLIDSTIWLDLDTGESVFFPVSIDSGGDERFFDALVETWRNH